MVEPMAMSRSELPLDLLPRIVSFLDSPHDIYQLCLVCRKFVFYCREALYDGSRFRCCKPDFGSRTDDYRRFAKLLGTLGRFPYLSAHVEEFVFPAFNAAHERYNELLESALLNCANASSFRWRASEPMPTPVLRSLVCLPELRVLDIKLGGLGPQVFSQTLGCIHFLEGVRLRDISEELIPHILPWVRRLSPTLRSLTIENAVSLDNKSLQELHLPQLRSLMLSNCPEISTETIYCLLLCATEIEQLYLNLTALSISKLVNLLKENPTPRFTRLRKVSLPYEPTLAYWLHVQELLTHSPIEVFHIIQSTVVPMSTIVPFPLAQHGPARHRYRADILSHMTPPPPLSLASRRRKYPLHLRVRDSFTNSYFHAFGGSTPPPRPISVELDDGFVRRFVHLHGETLSIIWVVGMDISESSLNILRSSCPNIERIRANDIEEEFQKK